MKGAPAKFAESLIGVVLLFLFPACIPSLSAHRTVYEHNDIRIGLEADPFISHTGASYVNTHPAPFTPEQIRQLLGVLEITGYSGTLAALIAEPIPRPVFSQEELTLIVGPIAEAFHQATPKDRVFFSIPNLRARYHDERTEGAVFFRSPNFFILLRDHSAFIRTDTGGGDDERDPRDHRAMRLSAVTPIHAVTPPEEDSPRWGPYEQVHLGVNVQEVFTAFTKAASIKQPTKAEPNTVSETPVSPKGRERESADDLRLQIRELTSANQDLRKQLAEQAAELEALKDSLIKLQQDLNQSKTKSGSHRKNKP